MKDNNQWIILFLGKVDVSSCSGGHRSSAKAKTICCGAHEEPFTGCSNPCLMRRYECEYYNKSLVCPLYCRENTFPTCVCKYGYYWNKCRRCVRPHKCKAKCTMETVTQCKGPNEVYVGCLSPKKHRRCSNRGRDLTAKYGELCETQMCDCEPPYWRNRCGKCVLACECHKHCETHSNDPCPQPSEERVGCGCNGKSKYAKQRKCSGCITRYRRNRRNKHKCICKNGFVQSNCNSKRCILEEKCSAPCLCNNPCAGRKHEVYTVVNSCNIRTCENKDRRYLVACSLKGTLACDCGIGYWRNATDDTGVCVPPEQCPTPAPVTAVSSNSNTSTIPA